MVSLWAGKQERQTTAGEEEERAQEECTLIVPLHTKN